MFLLAYFTELIKHTLIVTAKRDTGNSNVKFRRPREWERSMYLHVYVTEKKKKKKLAPN